jgi:hypothetical protein
MSRFVRVSTPRGHFTVPAATAERAGSAWRVLKQDAVDKFGRPLPPKPRESVETALATPKRRKKKAATKLRDETAAATPTTEAPASDVSTEE